MLSHRSAFVRTSHSSSFRNNSLRALVWRRRLYAAVRRSCIFITVVFITHSARTHTAFPASSYAVEEVSRCVPSSLFGSFVCVLAGTSLNLFAAFRMPYFFNSSTGDGGAECCEQRRVGSAPSPALRVATRAVTDGGGDASRRLRQPTFPLLRNSAAPLLPLGRRACDRLSAAKPFGSLSRPQRNDGNGFRSALRREPLPSLPLARRSVCLPFRSHVVSFQVCGKFIRTTSRSRRSRRDAG